MPVYAKAKVYRRRFSIRDRLGLERGQDAAGSEPVAYGALLLFSVLALYGYQNWGRSNASMSVSLESQLGCIKSAVGAKSLGARPKPVQVLYCTINGMAPYM